jgi:5-(carboxyamino)imidazole ribonucleotide mutase
MKMPQSDAPLVGVIMGSRSDWPTLQRAVEVLETLKVPHERKVVSAHRTPQLAREYAESAEDRGLEVIIAGAGGAAHLPGMVAALTVLPVIGVPVAGRTLSGLDALLSMAQMPSGVPVATMAIGEPGARNAGYLAVAILGRKRPEYAERLRAYRAAEAARIADETLP